MPFHLTSSEDNVLGEVQPLDLLPDSDQVKRLVQVCKMLSDESRLSLMLKLHSGGEMNVGHMTDYLGVSQPAVSHHLALMRVSGMVSAHRVGKNNIYSATNQSSSDMNDLLKLIVALGMGNNGELPRTGIVDSLHTSSEVDNTVSPEVTDAESFANGESDMPQQEVSLTSTTAEAENVIANTIDTSIPTAEVIPISLETRASALKEYALSLVPAHTRHIWDEGWGQPGGNAEAVLDWLENGRTDEYCRDLLKRSLEEMHLDGEQAETTDA